MSDAEHPGAPPPAGQSQPAGPRAAGAGPARPNAGQNNPGRAAQANVPAAAKPAGRPVPPSQNRPAANALAGRVAAAPFTMNAEVLQLNIRALVRQQRRKFLIKLFIFVLLPTILTALYTLAYASPRYVSEFQIGYKSNDPSSSTSTASSGMLSSLLGGAVTMDMTKVLRSMLTSEKMLEIVDRKINLRKAFSAPSIDAINRMPADAPNEKFLEYFRRRVTVYEQTGGFLIVDVEGFTRDYAKTFATALIDAADGLVSDMNDRSKKDMVKYTEKEMLRYEEALKAATRDITEFREKYNDYDFTSTVGLLGGVVGALQGQLAAAKSELANSRTFLGDNAPTVKVLYSKIKALETQIQAEQNRLASASSGGIANGSAGGSKEPYSQVMAKYADLVQTQDFARQTYLNARQTHEAARLDAARKSAYAVSFVPPNLPEDATEPSFWRSISAVFGGSLLLYSFAHVLFGMLRDQAGL